jgi:hypothetical protein
MKKTILFFVILIISTSIVYGAPRAKIMVRNVTPDFLLANSSLTADSAITSGMNVVPNKTYVYLSVKNFGDTTSIASQTWTFLSKPSGSGATLTSIPALGWYKFRADSTGTYTVNVHIVTSSGTKDTSMNIYSANFVGVGNFDNVPAVYPNCMTCHASMPAFQTIFNNWKVSSHATTFKHNIDSGEVFFGISCMKCHTTGYDHNQYAVNGGFDDKAKTLGWVWSNWSPPKPHNWDSLKTKYPSLVSLAGVTCESCHGPGSEHIATTDTNKMDRTVSSGKCGQCHDQLPFEFEYAQWKTSIHANCVFEGRTVADSVRNTFNDCNRCHDGETYIGFTKGRKTAINLTTADQEVIGCASCHDPHGTPNAANLRTRITGSDTLSGGIHYPTSVGTATVCLDCHKARKGPLWYIVTRGSFTSTWGPHESPQGDVVLGKNAAMFNGVPYLGGSHSNMSDLCIKCHMATTTDTGTVQHNKVGGHTWNLHDAASNYDHVSGCQGCHPGVSSFEDFMAPQDFDGNNLIESWQKEVAGCISKLGHALPHTGYDTVNWQVIARDSNNLNLRKAYWNYLLIRNDKSFGLHNPFFAVQVLLTSVQYSVGVQNISNEVPFKYELSQNYPNPFNPSTKINFSIPKAENVTIKIYDITGKEVISLVNQKMSPGKYTTEWLGINGNGVKVASGVYFYRMITPSYVEVKKMVLVK